MAVTKDDFEKIWASTSPLTPYQFNDAQYKEGWNFVGSTPPSRQMWDAFMQNADEKLKYLYQHEDVPLGHEYFTFNPNVPQGSLPLFGGEYSRETYADLWNWVQEQTGYLKTEAEWQTLSASNNGNVPYYSDGDGSTTFRVPSLKCWVKGANGTVSEVGSYLEAGLPDIIGSFYMGAGNGTISANGGTGSFIASTPIALNKYSYSGTYTRESEFKFFASNSNPIYGKSTTVQPPSIVGMWLVKAYGVIVDTGQIDEQAYIDDRFNASKQYTDDKIAPIGTVETNSNSGSVSFSANTGKTITSVSLGAGTWVIIGHAQYNPVSSGKEYCIGISNVQDSFGYGSEGSVSQQSSIALSLVLNNCRIMTLSATETIYLNAYADTSATVVSAHITAVRII